MTDVYDRAQATDEMFLRHALEEQRRKAGGPNVRPEDWRVTSAEECQAPHCGEPIPQDRRRAVPGVRLCVECQDRQEKLGRKT